MMGETNLVEWLLLIAGVLAVVFVGYGLGTLRPTIRTGTNRDTISRLKWDPAPMTAGHRRS
jgi:hypothetical protein